MLQRLTRQFSGPEGALGHVAGWLMTRRNGPANAWIVELLDAGAEDRVLEIGFGPGLAARASIEDGGTARCEPGAEGGTRFVVELPAASPRTP